MSRIVFASELRKVIGNKGAMPAPFYARPKFWAPLVLLNCALVGSIAAPWSSSPVAIVAPTHAPSLSALAAPAPASANATIIAVPEAPAAPKPKAELAREPLTPQGQRAAQYIAKNYHIAREAAQLIVHEAFKAGKAHRVDPLLLLAIIGIESRYNPLSESEAGALGLTQAMPESHPEKVAAIAKQQGHILNIGDNIELGAKVIGEYLRKFDNNSVLALQQYNGSLNDSSRFYSSKVLALRAKMQ